MGQLIFASLSHTHYWYEVSMLKVPADVIAIHTYPCVGVSVSVCVCVCLCVCLSVCVSVCVFIKLHITAQSGPVILVILCHSH